MSSATSRVERTISMCADDFGLSAAVDDAVMRLAGLGRVQAVSCMAGGARWATGARLLKDAPEKLSVGLHFVLTRVPQVSDDGADEGDHSGPTPGQLLVRALRRQIDLAEVADRFDRQLDRFEAAVGRRPDHIDGHHHVHAMPGIAEILSHRLARRYGEDLPWLRLLWPCLPSPTARIRQSLIGHLGRRQRRVLAAFPIPANPAFGGVRSFRERCAYGIILKRQLSAVKLDGTLIMCHPGLPDGDATDDEIAASRVQEYAFLAGPDFPDLLSRLNLRLAAIPLRRLADARLSRDS
jgi:predicted glycoside hydrolase/deacetylase ChbG (UPF0249 family)